MNTVSSNTAELDASLVDLKEANSNFMMPFAISAFIGFIFGVCAVIFQYFAVKSMTKGRQLHKKRVKKGKGGATTSGTTVGGETTAGATTAM